MDTVVQVILTTLLSCTVSTLFITVRDKLNKRHRQKQKMSAPREKRGTGRKKGR